MLYRKVLGDYSPIVKTLHNHLDRMQAIIRFNIVNFPSKLSALKTRCIQFSGVPTMDRFFALHMSGKKSLDIRVLTDLHFVTVKT